MPSCVIDKSYLFGAPKVQLQALFQSYDVVMTEALFYELLTTEPSERARCFERLPAIYNPVLLVPNLGPILRWEIENAKPLRDLRNIAINEAFRFNPELAKIDYEMDSENMRNLEEWHKETKRWIEDYVEHASNATQAFTTLESYSPGQDASKLEEIKGLICSDREFVREFYHPPDQQWPSFETIDEHWALYRWLQIRLLAALDYFRKYGKSRMPSHSKVVENEYHDLEYCLVGCLCGALATRDSAMANRYSSLCVNGRLMQ